MLLAPESMQPDKNLKPITSWIITAQQASEILGVSIDIIWELADAGHIQRYRVSPTETRVWMDDVLGYAERIATE